MTSIIVNGQTRAIPEGQTITGLLSVLELDPQQVAVELNREIVKRPRWESTVLESGAQVEIVRFVGGG